MSARAQRIDLARQFAEAADVLATIRDHVRFAASRFREYGLFFGHGVADALGEAELLVAHALHLPVEALDRLMDAVLAPAERAAVLELVRRRIELRMPAPYLTGKAYFAGLEFAVDPRVLIPRSPIAQLIEQGFEPWLDPERVRRVLDLGTGSGCIAVACAHLFPDALVDASDVSADALQVAARNVEAHGVADRVCLVRSDLFAHLPEQRYDLIVTNPPYVDAEEMAALPAEFTHEPRLALASGADGLDCIERILAGSGRYLAPDGLLVAEVGASRPALERAHPELAFTWVDLQGEAEGVFVLEASALAAGV